MKARKPMAVQDAHNLIIWDICTSFGAIYLDPRPVLGQFRPGGPAGNTWDIKSQYDEDGIHYNTAGENALADAIYILLAGPYSIVSGSMYGEVSSPRAPVPYLQLNWKCGDSGGFDKSHAWPFNGRIIGLQMESSAATTATLTLNVNGVDLASGLALRNGVGWARIPFIDLQTGEVRVRFDGQPGNSGVLRLYYWQ